MRVFTLGFLIALYAPTTVCVAAAVSRVIPGTNTTTTGDNVISAEEKTSGSTRTTRAQNTMDNTDRTAITRSVVRTIPTEAANNTQTTRSAGRSVAVTRSQTTQNSARSNLETAVRNSGRSQRTEAASINANPAVRRMGLTLRPSTAEVGGRAILESGAQTGSNMATEISNLSPRIATIQTRKEEKLDPASIAEAKDQLEQKAALNKSCQEQYNDCMDQFCAVIDVNQKRCSCSTNLSKYVKVEEAVKEANTKLNEIAQNIRYVGLSADEISAIMSATEAEEAMTGVVDTTENRTLLSKIEQMIKDPKTTSSSSYAVDSYGLLDIDLDFSSDDVSDLFSLDFLSGSNNSFSNLRGGELYKAAKKRCETVIKQCREVGATSEQITGNYDLAIDKDCIAYEQGLTKMNETLVSNVRSATRMLQKARLAVLQNQNTYDAIGCISALETCMKDDMVCGEDYTKCLDPTKMFIDENGSVVLGQNINNIQKFMSEYNNAATNSSTLRTAAGITTINNESCADEWNDGRCVVKYLLTKIGMQEDATAEGLCRPVLDKCRAYTYDSRGKYIPFNDIVVNYIQRAMVNIKAAQYQIVADYASTCLSDIATCYNNQVSQLTSWSATAAASSVYNIMRGACRNVALTCGYAVFSADNDSCPKNSTSSAQTKCIESISEIFYQSLLCPDNSMYMMSHSNTVSANNAYAGWVNTMCKCNDGFVTINGACLPVCDNGGVYLSTGVCSEGASCSTIRYAHEVDASLAEFWGHCACNTDYHWYNAACRKCPRNSTENPNGTGDALGGACSCDHSNASNPYLVSPNGLYCKQCPSNTSHFENGTCVCENESHTYFRALNCCGPNERWCIEHAVEVEEVILDSVITPADS